MTTDQARDFILSTLKDTLSEAESEDFVAPLDEDSFMYFDADDDGDGPGPWFVVTVRRAAIRAA